MSNDRYTVGCDEAGVGSLMGPLVACAVHIPDGLDVSELQDSKKIKSHEKRKRIASYLKDNVEFGIGIISNEEIDSIGMARCRRLVFERSLDDFERKYNQTPELALIDGTLFDGWKNINFECHIQGDDKFHCISAASIIAKVERDELVLNLDNEKYAQYEWVKNKGYGTKTHIAAIQEHGVTEYHRKSFTFKK